MKYMKDMKKKMNSKVIGWVRKVLPFYLFTFLPLTGFAQDSKSQYHPINHAVISQTIAPDARSAGMGDIIRMSTHSIGIPPSIRSVSVRLVWH